MLENRDHGRGNPGASRPPGFSLTNLLLILNVVVFLGQTYVKAKHPAFPINQYLGLSLDGLRHGHLWQLLSFQFLHGGIFHLLINSWGIYVFGPPVEHAVGSGRFLWLYLLSGLFGGVVHVLGSLIFPIHFGSMTVGSATAYIPVVGASAGLFGLIAAFATLFPRQELTVYLFFILPVTVTARVLLGVCAGIGLLGVFLAGDHVAHGAHLGGMLMGFVYARLAATSHPHIRDAGNETSAK
jgi:membrane associated rhomboid family serine protease